MSELVLTYNPKILQYLWKPLNLFPNLCLYCSCSYDYFCEKGTKFHLFEPWNLFAKLSWAHVYTVYVPMIILVKRGQKLLSGAGGVYFLTPKSLLRLPHLWKFLNLLAKFSRTYVSAILCSYDYFCEKEQIMHRGKGGGAFFNLLTCHIFDHFHNRNISKENFKHKKWNKLV